MSLVLCLLKSPLGRAGSWIQVERGSRIQVELGSQIQVFSVILPSLVPSDPFIGQVKDSLTFISDPGDKMQNHNLIYTAVKIHGFHLDRRPGD